MSESKPTKPPVVVVLSQAQVERAALGHKKYAFDVPKGATELVLTPYGEKSGWERELVERYSPQPGSVLVQCPFDHDLYALRENAELVFEREKLRRFSELCALLGATRVTSDTNTLRVYEEETQRSGRFGKRVAKKKVAEAEVDMSTTQRREWEQSLAIDDVYQGARPDVSQARELLRAHGLEFDSEIAGLVEARAGQNLMKSRTVKLIYTGKDDHNLQVAAAVTLPQVDVGFKSSKSTSALKKIIMKLHVEFGNG